MVVLVVLVTAVPLAVLIKGSPTSSEVLQWKGQGTTKQLHEIVLGRCYNYIARVNAELRAKEFKTRLGILLHKPDLGYKIGSLSRSTKQRYALEEVLGWKESFDHLLRSKSGVAAFHGFLKTEFSEENLEFWLACEEYKKTHSKAKLAAKANRIFEDFVQNEAPKEVNLDHETREATRRNLTIANPACFEEAQAKTHTLMEKDSYPRFLKSAYYRDLTEQATSHRTGKPTHT